MTVDGFSNTVGGALSRWQQFSFGFSPLEINDIVPRFEDEKSSNAARRRSSFRAAVRPGALFSASQHHALVGRAALCEPRYFGIHLHRSRWLGAAGGAMGAAMVCGQTVRTRSCHRAAGAA